MWEESAEPNKQDALSTVPALKTGLTTGTCATACCVALAYRLLKSESPSCVSVTLPRGKIVELKIQAYQEKQSGSVYAETIKDAGDDPDVTHGAVVFVELSLKSMMKTEVGDCSKIKFKALSGVGRVTRPGLLLSVGEPAINPVPRKMMTEHLVRVAQEAGYQGGFEVGVGIQNGKQIALKTMNPRLGIEGGLSILGTTGIVRPFSCGAWIASIYQSMDVASANGIRHLAASTGNSSEAAIRAKYHLSDMALVEMGDFVGAVLKHLKQINIEKLSICGGFGKMTKLAQGHMDLHSRSSSVDFQSLSEIAASQGADHLLQQKILEANTSMQVLELCITAGIDIVDCVCQSALEAVLKKVSRSMTLEVWVINRKGEFVGSAVKAKRA